MLEKFQRYECDRCGSFSPMAACHQNAEEMAEAAGWEVEIGEDLCPQCLLEKQERNSDQD